MVQRIVVVHDLVQARAALAAAAECGVFLVLRSAPGAAGTLGAPVFRAMIEEARSAHPEVRVLAVLDCGDAPGLALNALRHGIEALRLAAPADLRARIAAIAAQSGAHLRDDREDDAVLDLLEIIDPFAAVRSWLAPEPKKD